jgi:GNAT superfamily N-acetyltransferase
VPARIRIRPLTIRDRAGVRRITLATWGDDDYIPAVFTRWLKDGGFFGAELDGELVGFAKLTRMSRTEAFFEGMRVHPKARERGVGGALIDHRLRRARRRGMRVARFVTWSENRPMHRMARRFGFRRVGEDAWLKARPKSGPGLRVATSDDVAALASIARTHRGLLREDHHASRFRALTRDDIVSAVRDRRALVLDGARGPRAFAILGRNRDRTAYLAARPGALGEFARRYRAYARRRPHTRVFLAIPRSMQRAIGPGYEKRGRGYGVVYERALGSSR